MRTNRGNTAVIVALGFTTILAFGAFTVDLGYVRVVQAQLQNAADAGSHAGTAQLNGTAEGIVAARAMAATVTLQNLAGGTPVEVSPEDIHVGVWDGLTFTEGGDPADVNAVRVDARAPGVPLFFAPAAVGQSSLALAAQATMNTVHSGASAVDCYMPIAMPDCVVEQVQRDGLQDITLTLNPAPGDNVGYARANGSVNAAFTRDQVADCTAGGTASVGDPLTLQNGEAVSALDAVVDAISGSSTTWDASKWGVLSDPMDRSSIPASKYGHTFEGVVLVFDAPDEYCTGGGAWNGEHQISGFVWGAVFDARNSGAAADRTLRMRLDTSEIRDIGTSGGGLDLGIMDWSPPRMVQ